MSKFRVLKVLNSCFQNSLVRRVIFLGVQDSPHIGTVMRKTVGTWFWSRDEFEFEFD